jgi:hypothetical protein
MPAEFTPSPEFLKLLSLVDEWSLHDKEYIWESSLKKEAPEYVHNALKELIKIQKELDKEGSCI